MSEALALVERLEEISLEELLDEPEELALMVQDRQAILDALATIDVAALPDAERVEFKRRVQDVLTRDQALMLQLAEKRDEILKALEHVRSGRRAVNGYAQMLAAQPATGRRFG